MSPINSHQVVSRSLSFSIVPQLYYVHAYGRRSDISAISDAMNPFCRLFQFPLSQ